MEKPAQNTCDVGCEFQASAGEMESTMQNTTWSIDVLPQPQLSDVEVQEMGGKQQKTDAKNKRCTPPKTNMEPENDGF